MNKQLIAVIVGAVILFVAAVAGTLAFTGGDAGGNMDMMRAGRTMTGPMHTMSSGEHMSGRMHSP